MGRLRSVLELTATAATIVVCVALTWTAVSGRGGLQRAAAPTAVKRRPPEPPIPTEPLSLNGAATKGSSTAKVAMIEFSDFQCPYCGAFARETLPTLQQKYIDTGKLLIAFRQFPLESIHSSALRAAEAAECAGGQGKFWPMYDQSFRHQQQLDDAAGPSALTGLGLDAPAFNKCMSGGIGERLVRTDEALGRQLQVSGTPTFFVGVMQTGGRVKVMRRFSGSPAAADFIAIVDAVMAKTEAESPR